MTGKDGIRARCLRASRKILCLTQRPDTSDTIAHHHEVPAEPKRQPGHARDNDLRQHHHEATAESGAYVYILDTGIDISHDELSGRAIYGANFIPRSPDFDECGHGTNMAEIIGGKTYGVAENCTIISVKIVGKDGRGKMSHVTKGIQWVIQDAARRGASDRSVINISLRGPYHPGINHAVKMATNAGITVVVAAGNDAKFACAYSPASASTAITVAETGPDGCRRPWSNYGPRVNVFALGSSIPTASIVAGSGRRYGTGTSVAAAYVSGLAAHFISSGNLRGYKAVRSRILSVASKGVVKDPRCSRNLLVFNGVLRN
ncbi:cuticle-degrading protease [Fusarium sp. NRRL 52700]|nr:cuticle-degrading protease [Fusarium sp. NRRL 52700]